MTAAGGRTTGASNRAPSLLVQQVAVQMLTVGGFMNLRRFEAGVARVVAAGGAQP